MGVFRASMRISRARAEKNGRYEAFFENYRRNIAKVWE
jgi:hypothetical protein